MVYIKFIYSETLGFCAQILCVHDLHLYVHFSQICTSCFLRQGSRNLPYFMFTLLCFRKFREVLGLFNSRIKICIFVYVKVFDCHLRELVCSEK